MTFSSRFLMLIAMILTAAGPIMYFFVCGAVLTMAFAFTGYVLFSTEVYDFRDMSIAFMNGFKYWVTEMDISLLRTSHRKVGLVFFIVWTVVFLLILANVFVAILADAYVLVQNQVRERERVGLCQMTAWDVFTKSFATWIDKFQ